jgi:hypothetical protein
MISQVRYTLTRGLAWERLVVVKDRSTRRVVRPIEAWGAVKIGTNITVPLNVEITGEGSLMLYLTEQETANLPLGELQFDVVAVVNRRSALASGGWKHITTPVVAGAITVSDSGLVSDPALGDVMNVLIKFAEGEDFYTTFVWKDEEGTVLPVTNAFMQAKDDAGATVLDLRWYQTIPNETAISALPGAQRGYLSPLNDNSLELHISDLNSVPAGTYQYDLFVQGAANQWTRLVRGSVIVEESVSVRP